MRIRRCRVLPPEETKVVGLPTWVTEELLEKTIRVWSKVMRRAIDKEEALAILIGTSRLMDYLQPSG